MTDITPIPANPPTAAPAVHYDLGTETFPWGHPALLPPIRVAPSANRGLSSVLSATTDAEAAAAWLAEKSLRSQNTAAAYRLQTERLLIWASVVLGKSLSELSREDFIAYQRWLSDIPQSWIGSNKRAPRNSEEYRLFHRQLTPSGLKQALVVCYSLMRYLVKVGWLKANPMPQPQVLVDSVWSPVQRSLSREAMDCIFRSIAAEVPSSEKEKTYLARDRWMVAFFMGLACRTSETITTMGSIQRSIIDGSVSWVWIVIGKGGKAKDIPVPDWVMDELALFRQRLTLPKHPLKHDPIPVFPTLDDLQENGLPREIPTSMSRQAIYRWMKRVIFARAARFAASIGRYDLADELSTASPHWLRHTSLRETAEETLDMRIVQAKGRHSNINTSAGYVQPSLKELRNAMNTPNRFKAASG